MKIGEYNCTFGAVMSNDLGGICFEKAKEAGVDLPFKNFNRVYYKDLELICQLCGCTVRDLLSETGMDFDIISEADQKLLEALSNAPSEKINNAIQYITVLTGVPWQYIGSDGKPFASPSTNIKLAYIAKKGYQTLPKDITYLEQDELKEYEDGILGTKSFSTEVLLNYARQVDVSLRWVFCVPDSQSFWGYEPVVEILYGYLKICAVPVANLILASLNVNF